MLYWDNKMLKNCNFGSWNMNLRPWNVYLKPQNPILRSQYAPQNIIFRPRNISLWPQNAIFKLCNCNLRPQNTILRSWNINFWLWNNILRPRNTDLWPWNAYLWPQLMVFAWLCTVFKHSKYMKMFVSSVLRISFLHFRYSCSLDDFTTPAAFFCIFTHPCERNGTKIHETEWRRSGITLKMVKSNWNGCRRAQKKDDCVR